MGLKCAAQREEIYVEEHAYSIWRGVSAPSLHRADEWPTRIVRSHEESGVGRLMPFSTCARDERWVHHVCAMCELLPTRPKRPAAQRVARATTQTQAQCPCAPCVRLLRAPPASCDISCEGKGVST